MKKLIGYGLILLSIWLVADTVMSHRKRVRAFEAAKQEILLMVSGCDINEKKSLTVKYRFAHGVSILNAESLEEKDIAQADIELKYKNTSRYYKFQKDAEDSAGESDYIVIRKKKFNGEIIFKNSVCGCEKMATEFAMVIATGIGLVISAIGIFLIFKKRKKQEKESLDNT